MKASKRPETMTNLALAVALGHLAQARANRPLTDDAAEIILRAKEDGAYELCVDEWTRRMIAQCTFIA